LSADTTNHHGSHRNLVTTVRKPEPAKVDAIIVPTARKAASLEAAMRLAKHHQCPIVTFCSIYSKASETRKLAKSVGVEIVAMDLNKRLLGVLPAFATTRLLRETHFGKFHRRTDTSDKRNLGLLLAWMTGWERIVFVDDDIDIPFAEDLSGAVGALGPFASVGLSIGGFPDNSVVCHAYRIAGGKQDTFIGGGALAVGEESFNSFFPTIYNEDWFFLLNDDGLRPSAVTNGLVTQKPYDPFRDPMRARMEELGDSLAEGLFRLLDDKRPLTDANHRYWADFLTKRRRFIDEVIAMVGEARLAEAKNPMIESLKAAKGRNWVIDPQLCVDYMDAWRADREVWRDQINTTGRRLGLEKALAELGLMDCHQVAA
jgi:hypothetical protein